MNPKERLSIPEILNHHWLKDPEKEDMNSAYLTKKECSIKLDNPSGNLPVIEYLNVGNIFTKEENVKLDYTDYTFITNEFETTHLDDNAIRSVESMGYSRDSIIKSLKDNQLNHATASYYLLIMN